MSNIVGCFGTQPCGPAGMQSYDMAAAQGVVVEVLQTCRQQDLLALRRSTLPATPIRSTRKSDLVADVAAECDALANRQRIFAEVMVDWTMHDMRCFMARLKGLGYVVPIGQRPRRPDLMAAIINTREYVAKAPVVSKRMRKDLCSSASACSSAGVAEHLGPCSEGTTQDSCSSTRNSCGDPGSAAEPPSCTAMVALDSSAAPLKLQQKMFKRWSKKWARFTKKNDRKHKLKRVADELRKALQDHRATSTVGDLRDMVGQAVGLPLDGKYRLRFDRALVKLTSAPPKKRRKRCRFTIAKDS